MDEIPFLVFDIEHLRDSQIESIKKFSKEDFDIEKIMGSANELKYMTELKKLIKDIVENPTPDFVKSLAKNIYSGKFTENVLTQFSELVRKAAASYINDRIAERLNIAVKTAEEDQKQTDTQKVEIPGSKKQEIVTTQEEQEAYYTIKAILRAKVAGERVFMRDAMSYCAIILDDNNRKNICRLYFNNENNLRIEFVDADGNSERIHIDSIDEIYNYSDRLLSIVERYL